MNVRRSALFFCGYDSTRGDLDDNSDFHGQNCRDQVVYGELRVSKRRSYHKTSY